LIEWEGYHITDNTWEEEANVFSDDAINKFYNDYHKLSNINLRDAKELSKQPHLLHDSYDPDSKTFTPTTAKSLAKPKEQRIVVISTSEQTQNFKRLRIDEGHFGRNNKMKRTEHSLQVKKRKSLLTLALGIKY
jgi:hypothetical protein